MKVWFWNQPRNLLELQILLLYFGPAESETQWSECQRPPGDSGACSVLTMKVSSLAQSIGFLEYAQGTFVERLTSTCCAEIQGEKWKILPRRFYIFSELPKS